MGQCWNPEGGGGLCSEIKVEKALFSYLRSRIVMERFVSEKKAQTHSIGFKFFLGQNRP